MSQISDRFTDRELQVSVPGGVVERAAEDDSFGRGTAGTQADVTLADITIRGKKISANIEDSIIDAKLRRTIEGASVVTITITDYDRTIGKSAMVKERSILEIQGVKFVLVKVKKKGDQLELTFEDWAVNQLRQKKKAKKAIRGSSNGKVTRAQFAEMLVKEIPGLKFYSPEKNLVQDTYPAEDHGVPDVREAPTGQPDAASGGGPGAGTYENWARDFLDMFGYPQTQANLDAMCAWMLAEAGGVGRRSQFNPLNTSHDMPGATPYNPPHGVKNYPGWDTGVRASYLTLASTTYPSYANIRAALTAGTDAHATCVAIDSSVWGTEHATSALSTVQASRTLNYHQMVPGATATTPRNQNDNDTTQTATNQEGQQPGFDDGTTFTIQGDRATRQEIRNIERVLKKGDKMGMNDWILCAAVLCIIVDSEGLNHYTEDSPSLDEDVVNNTPRFGIFQFKISDYPGIQGWTLEQQAAKFYTIAKRHNDIWKQSNPGTFRILHRLVNDVTRRDMESFEDYGARYTEWEPEAINIVQLFVHHRIGPGGVPRDDIGPGGGTYDQQDFNAETNSPSIQRVVQEPCEFTRGTPERPEDSWSCLQRLADEVNWRCFCVNKTIYFCRDKVLLKNKVLDTISEFERSVDYIDYDYDVGKPVSMITVQCRASRWSVIPGATVIIKDAGPATGRYIVQEYERSMHSDRAVISLIGAQPQLLEPAPDTHVESFDPDGPGGEAPTSVDAGIVGSIPFDETTRDGMNRVVRWAQSKVRGPGPTAYRYGEGHFSYAWFLEYPNYNGPWDCSSFVSHAFSFVEIDMVSGGGATGGQWNDCVRWGVARGGTAIGGHPKPPDGWQPGDLIWPHDNHIMIATGVGAGTVEAKGRDYGIVNTQRATDSVYKWARPGQRLPDEYRGPDPDDVPPNVRFD